MSTALKRVKLSLDTPNSPNDAIEDGRDHDLDLEDSSQSKSEDHHTSPGSLQVNHHNQYVRHKDPMKIKLVLERVFEFCSVESLKNCRLVSTEWRDESESEWRNKAVLRCSTASVWDYKLPMKEYLQLVGSDEFGDDNGDDGDDAIKFRRLKKYPFKRFSLRLRFYSDWDEFSSGALRPISDTTRYRRINVEQTRVLYIAKLKNFLSSFHSLEFLHFQLSYMECYDPKHEEITEGFLDFTLPTVKRLEISHSENANVEAEQCWEYVLKWFPNLEALSLKYEDIKDSECLKNLRRFLTFAENIRKSRGESVLALKELELLTNPSAKYPRLAEKKEEITRLILACNFPLERLNITFAREMIYQLMEFYKNTLEYLEASFEFDVCFDNLRQQFMKKKNISMTKLKEISIGNGFLRAMDFLTLRLELPQIEKLRIEKIKRDKKKEAKFYPPSYLPKGIVYERLETLEILDTYTRIPPFMIKTIAKMMPNLLHLTMPLDKEMFEIVCDKFRGLRTLNVLSMQWPHSCCDELDDESITGISKEAKDGAPRRHNITDLALLTDLKISCDWQLRENRVAFTDHSVIHGFLQLPRLHSLSIAVKDLSEDMKAKLVNQVKGDLCIQDKPIDDVDTDGDSETNSDEDEDSSWDESDSSVDEY